MQAEVLEDLLHQHRVVPLILEHRSIRKLVEGFIACLTTHLTRAAAAEGRTVGGQVRTSQRWLVYCSYIGRFPGFGFLACLGYGGKI